MPNITLYDYLLLPVYLLIIYKIAFSIRNKYYPEGHQLRKFFLPGLTVKIVGAIFISLIYAYYYKGGDTFGYFDHIKLVNSNIYYGLDSWWHVLTNSERPDRINEVIIADSKYYKTPDTYTVWQISSIISFCCFNLFLPLTVVLALISYSGVWLIFRYFSEQYPLIVKWLAISCLFIPTVFVWGSGLFKDTYCQMAIGWLLWGIYSIFSKNKLTTKYVLLILFGSIILIKIKVYIFLAFFPFLLISEIGKKIQEYKIKTQVFLYFIISILIFSSIGRIKTTLEKEVQKYSIEKIAETAKNSKDYFIRLAEEDQSSVFDIGEMEPTINGLINKFIPAINASLFRPYLWESRKPIVFIAALESTTCILLTIWAIFSLTRVKQMHLILNWNILFYLLFSIVLAFFIGVSTSNFGSLSRYKLPFMPFYSSALVIIIAQSRLLLSHVKK
jgi:hypothetical protein